MCTRSFVLDQVTSRLPLFCLIWWTWLQFSEPSADFETMGNKNIFDHGSEGHTSKNNQTTPKQTP